MSASVREVMAEADYEATRYGPECASSSKASGCGRFALAHGASRGRPRAYNARSRKGDRGAALVEFGLVLPFLGMMVFGVIDLGRGWQLQNRLSSAAREAAASVQFHPANLSTGCEGEQNAWDRAGGEDPDLDGLDGYVVTVVEVSAGGVESALAGCGGNALERGDTARVTVQANFDIITPLVGAITGDPIVMKRSVDVVVQQG